MKLLIHSQLQLWNRWSSGMDKYFHPTSYDGCNYLSMLRLKLTHGSKRGPRNLAHSQRLSPYEHAETDIPIYASGSSVITFSCNGLSPICCPVITWTNDLLLIRSFGTNFSEISIEIRTFLFEEVSLKMAPAKWMSFSFGLDILTKYRWWHNAGFDHWFK